MPKRLLVAPRKEIVLAAAYPPIALEVAFRKKLVAIVDEMDRSVRYWILAAYRRNSPEITTHFAADVSPAIVLRRVPRRLARRRRSRFAVLSAELAKWHADKADDRSEKVLKDTLDRAGFTVPFAVTPVIRDVLQACTSQNVALIKSIPAQHLSAVEGTVMRSVAAGYDLNALSLELEKQHGLTRERASLIARHQTRMITSSINRARNLEAGITEGIWVHSTGGRYPRPGHVEAGKRQTRFSLAKGCKIDGEFIMPGQLINCRCVWRPVIPALDPTPGAEHEEVVSPKHDPDEDILAPQGTKPESRTTRRRKAA